MSITGLQQHHVTRTRHRCLAVNGRPNTVDWCTSRLQSRAVWWWCLGLCWTASQAVACATRSSTPKILTAKSRSMNELMAVQNLQLCLGAGTRDCLIWYLPSNCFFFRRRCEGGRGSAIKFLPRLPTVVPIRRVSKELLANTCVYQWTAATCTVVPSADLNTSETTATRWHIHLYHRGMMRA